MHRKSPTKLEAWLMALRIRTLPIPTIQVFSAVGAAYALTGWLDGWAALCCWLIALFITIGTNLINDLFDFEKGGDPLVRVGQTKVLRAGYLSKTEIWLGGLAAFGVSLLFGFFLSLHAGWFIFPIILLSAVTGYCYTGGPFPICYLGLSEIFIVLFYGGVCILTSYYVQASSLSCEAFLLAAQMGLLAVIPNALNNFRDIYEDAEVNKKTLAVRFGKTFARWEVALLLAVPFLLNVGWLFLGHPYAFFLPYLLLPLALLLIHAVSLNDPGPQFLRYFQCSILIHFLYGCLVVLGLLI
jgi:1,4-dihydroxy-2-naphthoate octaprenyltransferase